MGRANSLFFHLCYSISVKTDTKVQVNWFIAGQYTTKVYGTITDVIYHLLYIHVLGQRMRRAKIASLVTLVPSFLYTAWHVLVKI